MNSTKELFRLASLIGCEPENEERHRKDLLDFIKQRETAALQTYREQVLEIVNKKREIYITNDLPSLLAHADGQTDETIKNWNALRTMITRDLEAIPLDALDKDSSDENNV